MEAKMFESNLRDPRTHILAANDTPARPSVFAIPNDQGTGRYLLFPSEHYKPLLLARNPVRFGELSRQIRGNPAKISVFTL